MGSIVGSVQSALLVTVARRYPRSPSMVYTLALTSSRGLWWGMDWPFWTDIGINQRKKEKY
jgi:hypothetical protein